jgi:hypothetical protein
MLPESQSQILGEGSFVIEPRPRLVLENAPDDLQDDIGPGSTYSSEDESLPMSTGFLAKQHNAHDYNDASSDPGKLPMKKHRKSSRHLRVRGSRNSLLPPGLSPSSSAIFADSLNLDTRSTFEEVSPGSQQVAGQSFFQSPELDAHSITKHPELPDLPDQRLDEALMAFSSLGKVDFLSELSTRSVSEPLNSLASVRWRQLTANWEHDEMMKAITMRPTSIHSFNDMYQHDERANDWSESWTTTAFTSKRDARLSLHDEFE